MAIFQDLGSSPATLEAAKACDCYGLLPGHTTQQADAVQAYTQSTLRGTPTWIRLPRDRWPASWQGMHAPVCPLRLALYGHPDSGGFWEQVCDSHLTTPENQPSKLIAATKKQVMGCGFVPMAEEWPSCYWHPKLRLFLVVYVDDFKLSGPTVNMDRGWELIRGGIDVEDPHPLDVYLGCAHRFWETKHDGKVIRGLTYDMESFLRSSVDAYVSKAKALGYNVALKYAPTPYIDPLPSNGAGGSAVLQPCAASILMKLLYAARLARPDLIRAVCFLARECTKWTAECDRALHRLMCYVHSSYALRLEGWVGDAQHCSFHVYADADFAG